MGCCRPSCAATWMIAHTDARSAALRDCTRVFVRFGSEADLTPRLSPVRFTPQSGQIADAPLVRANRVSAWRVWQTEHTVGGIQARRKKRGSRGGNCLKGWTLAVPSVRGAPNISGSNEHHLRGATKAHSGKGCAIPECCSAILVPSLRRTQPVVNGWQGYRGGS